MICELSICFGSFAISCTIGFAREFKVGGAANNFRVFLWIFVCICFGTATISRAAIEAVFCGSVKVVMAKEKLPVRNLILMPFAHIVIAVVGESGSCGARGNGGQVSSFNWEKISKSTGTERVKYHRPGKETGNKIQSAVAEKMETFGLNVISSQG